MARPTVPAVGEPNWGEPLRQAIFAVSDSTDLKVPLVASPIQFSTGTASIGVTPSDRAYNVRSLTGARMRVGGAPVGSGLIAQVQHFNTSWVTIATLTIAAASTTEATATFNQAQVVGDLVRINVTSVGSTTAATGVIVDVLRG